jgi:predicted secreted protein with PEFG-CTERM motif
VFALSAILIVSIGMTPAFGQIQNSIVVTTDKAAYTEGQTIVITGEVMNLYSGTPVSVIVKAPNGNLVSIAQVTVGADKKFSTEVTAGGALMKAVGAYTVTVQYGTENRSATATFEFGGSSTVTPPTPVDNTGITDTTVSVQGSSDLIGYEITGGKLLSVMPDVDANSLIISVDASEDGSLTLTIPRSVLDATINDGDDEFFVLVDGEEVDFDETTSTTSRTLTIPFQAGAEEIEIIGTFVVPEFGTIAAMILAVAIVSIIAISAKSRLSIMPRY